MENSLARALFALCEASFALTVLEALD